CAASCSSCNGKHKSGPICLNRSLSSSLSLSVSRTHLAQALLCESNKKQSFASTPGSGRSTLSGSSPGFGGGGGRGMNGSSLASCRTSVCVAPCKKSGSKRSSPVIRKLRNSQANANCTPGTGCPGGTDSLPGSG